MVASSPLDRHVTHRRGSLLSLGLHARPSSEGGGGRPGGRPRAPDRAASSPLPPRAAASRPRARSGHASAPPPAGSARPPDRPTRTGAATHPSTSRTHVRTAAPVALPPPPAEARLTGFSVLYQLRLKRPDVSTLRDLADLDKSGKVTVSTRAPTPTPRTLARRRRRSSAVMPSWRGSRSCSSGCAAATRSSRC